MLDPWTYLAASGVAAASSGIRQPEEPFFLDGDAVCAVRTCQYLTQVDRESFLRHNDRVECAAPTCADVFHSLCAMEAHYAACHRHECAECSKKFSSERLLEMHLEEVHDSFFKAKKSRMAAYECYSQTCPLKFWNAQERQRHCQTVHDFSAEENSFSTSSSSSASPTAKSRIPRRTSKGSLSPTSQPATPRRRVSLSLARMGEGLSLFASTSTSLSSSSNNSSQNSYKSRIPIPTFKRSTSCKIPSRISFGAFQDFEDDFGASELRRALPDL